MSFFSPILRYAVKAMPRALKSSKKQTTEVLNGLVKTVEQDGAQGLKLYDNGKLVEASIERISPNGIITKTKVKYGKDNSFLRKDTRYDKNATYVYMHAYNYKMPNGQIVNGDFSRENYFSFVDNKIVSRNTKGKNWFLSFFKDSNGVIHTTQKSHGGINWCGPDRNKSNIYM